MQQVDEISPPLVAVVDDDRDLRDALAALLEDNAFRCASFASGHAFFADPAGRDAVLAIVDLRLAGESGLALASRMRAERNLAVIMLTGTGSEIDKIVGLETGADDYILKPFNPRELIARVRAVLRRYGHGAPPRIPPHRAEDAVLRFGNKWIDLGARALMDESGAEIGLTNAEYRLLEFFLRHPDEVIPRVRLLEQMGSDLSLYVDRTIDVLILRLRRKIEAVPSKPVHLQTRRGKGYIFVTIPDGTADP